MRAIGICGGVGALVRPVCRSSVVARFWGIVGGLALTRAVLLGGFPSRRALSREIFASVGFGRVRGCNCWASGLPCAYGRFCAVHGCAWLRAVRLRVDLSALLAVRGGDRSAWRSVSQGVPLPYARAYPYTRCYQLNPRKGI